jgi:hypothetical protein
VRLALVLVVAALSLVAASCGGDDEEISSTTAWAEEFCATTRAWGDELERIGEDLDLSSISSDGLEQAGEEARDATDTYIEAIRDLGGPETESGDEIEVSVEELADEVEAERNEIEDAVDDASGLGGAVTAARDIASSVAAMFTALERTLEAIDEADVDGELETAFDEAESCEGFRGRS